MMNLINRFVTLPPIYQILVCLAGSGGLVAGLYTLGQVMHWPREVMLVIILGLIVVGLLIAGYAYLLKRRKKAKAKPFERNLAESGGAVPQNVSDVADRARLDEMRKKFELGLTTFRQRGKDLYSLPWYVIIGEPGSGKTEAIRHCNIGFPPGLQDELQGTGGTINMDWWFTNQAVILDTAGRLTFGDVENTDTREWKEFLALLRKSRPNCPINGLLVAIPVDSLIRDNADELERKGGRINRQLDLIQQSLNVRFPVFIVVTKADKLIGFRQFFSGLDDPQLQHQMVGWSNPLPLDEPFNPALVDDHLASVRERLMKRRLTRLLDQSSDSGNGAGRRIDRIDELYAFPEAMQRLSSRLRRYLELIFSRNEWSSNKPLFLRGIYFTSSMQHGEALDAELADALGVNVESLHESSWKDDRAYFLRDVFVEKVFREKGLVTNATDIRKRQRRRKIALLGTGAAAAALLLGFTLWAGLTYQEAIGTYAGFWTTTKDAYIGLWDEQRADLEDDFDQPSADQLANHKGRIVRRVDNTSRPGPYELNDTKDALPGGETLGEYFPLCQSMASERIDVPIAYRLPAFIKREPISNLFVNERHEACGQLLLDCVIEPLVQASAFGLDKLAAKEEPARWTDEAAFALAQLLDIHRASAEGIGQGYEEFASCDPVAWSFDVARTVRFVADESCEGSPLDEEARKEIVAEAASLQGVCNWLFSKDQGKQPWPPDALKAPSQAKLLAYVDAFNAGWKSELAASDGDDERTGDDLPDDTQGASSDGLVALRRVATCASAFQQAEEALLELEDTPDDELRRQQWDLYGDDDTTDEFGALTDAKDALNTAIKRANEVLGDKGLLAEKYASEFSRTQRLVARQYDRLLAAAQGKTYRPAKKGAEDSEIQKLWDESCGENDEPSEQSLDAHTPIVRELILGWGSVPEAIDETELARYQDLDNLLLRFAPGANRRHYEVRYDIYEIADSTLADEVEEMQELTFGTLASASEVSGGGLETKKNEITDIVAKITEEPDADDREQRKAMNQLDTCANVCKAKVIDELASQHLLKGRAVAFLGLLDEEVDENRNSLEELVARQVRDEDVEEELPEVPFTALDDIGSDSDLAEDLESFDRTVAARLFGDWKSCYELLANGDAEALADMDAEVAAYVKSYLEFWTEGILEEADPLRSTRAGSEFWPGVRSKLRADDEEDFKEVLDELGEAIIEAVDKAEDLLELRGKGDAGSEEWGGLRKIAESRKEQCEEAMDYELREGSTGKTVLEMWKYLESDALEAARTLKDGLVSGRRIRTGDYFIPSNMDLMTRKEPGDEVTLEDFQEQYWKLLFVKALNVLVVDAGTTAEDGLAGVISNYSAFPLVRSDRATRTLRPEEVRQAQQELAKVLVSAGAAAGGVDDRVNESEPPDPRDVTDILPEGFGNLFDRLWNPLAGVSGGNIDQIRSMAAMAEALPGNVRWTVTVYEHFSNRHDRVSAWETWNHMSIRQQGGSAFDGWVYSGSNQELVTLQYPGGDISVTFYQQASSDDNGPRTYLTPDPLAFTGDWAVMALIERARRIQLDPNSPSKSPRWRIQLVEEGVEFWLVLQFNDGPPPPNEALLGWPCAWEGEVQ